MKNYKNLIMSLSLKKIYSYFFLNDYKKSGYFNYLKNLYYQFLLSKFPKLQRAQFEENLKYLLNFEEDDLSARYFQTFEPDYTDDLNKYYKLNEKQIFLRFLKYSINTKLIKNKYSDVYDFAINRIKEPLEIIEIGGGIPHGLIFNIKKRGKDFCKKLNYIEADMLHAEFIDWYCKNNLIQFDKKIFLASKTPTINNINFNFVFAKDIFEHLDNPAQLIDELIANTNDTKTLLCLDLEHKGAITTQHINPNLPVLKQKLIDNNFTVIKKFQEIHVWQKIK